MLALLRTVPPTKVTVPTGSGAKQASSSSSGSASMVSDGCGAAGPEARRVRGGVASDDMPITGQTADRSEQAGIQMRGKLKRCCSKTMRGWEAWHSLKLCNATPREG